MVIHNTVDNDINFTRVFVLI